MITGHGGNIHETARRLGCRPEEIVDMSSNVNPIGPMPELIDHLRDRLRLIRALPEADAGGMIRAFAKDHDIDPDTVVAGNGSTQLIYTLPKALEAGRVLVLGPTYADYADACAMHRVPVDFATADPDQDFLPDIRTIEDRLGGVDTVFICNPNNPTGRMLPGRSLADLCRAHPDIRFVVDESYLPFCSDAETETLIRAGLPNLVVLSSMSKIFRIPGLRIGFAIAPPDLVQKLRRYELPWSVNSLAQETVRYLSTRKEAVARFIEKTRALVEMESERFFRAFDGRSGIRFCPGRAVFLLGRLSPGLTAETVCAKMAEERILIRNCANFKGLSREYIRISLKTPNLNDRAIERLQAVVG